MGAPPRGGALGRGRDAGGGGDAAGRGGRGRGASPFPARHTHPARVAAGVNNEDIRVQAAVQDAEAVADERRREEQQVVKDLQDVQNELAGLRKYVGGRDSVAAMFGREAPALLDAIARDPRRFSAPPIGPIGAHLSITDRSCAPLATALRALCLRAAPHAATVLKGRGLVGDHQQKLSARLPTPCAGHRYSATVSGALKGVLPSFIVNQRRDMLALQQLAKDLHVQTPNIYTYSYAVPQHNVPASAEPAPDLTTIRRVLQVRDGLHFLARGAALLSCMQSAVPARCMRALGCALRVRHHIELWHVYKPVMS